MAGKFAVLLDGGFVRRRLESQSRAAGRIGAVLPAEPEASTPSAADVLRYVRQLGQHSRLRRLELLRVYFYDSPPLSGTRRIPLSGRAYNFGSHPTNSINKRLQDQLAQSPDVALRRGELVFRGWRVRREALAELERAPRLLRGEDFVPEVEQKGVDLRLGLDVAVLAIKRIVDVAVLVTGDADLVPAMKLARREGLRVYLDTMGNPVRPSLTEHAECVLKVE